jgi:hypothetical protein
MGDLVQPVRMRDHKRTAGKCDHIELDRIDTEPDCGAKRLERILGCEPRRATVPEYQWPTSSARKIDQMPNSRWTSCAMNTTIAPVTPSRTRSPSQKRAPARFVARRCSIRARRRARWCQ